MSAQMKRIVTPKRLPPGRHSSSVMDHTTPKRTAAKRTDEDKKNPFTYGYHRMATTRAENIPPPTFGDEGSQKASRRARTESAKQGAAHHRRVGVGASIHHWVSGDKIGGLLCDIGTGATPHDNLDLIHVQVLEISTQDRVSAVCIIKIKPRTDTSQHTTMMQILRNRDIYVGPGSKMGHIITFPASWVNEN